MWKSVVAKIEVLYRKYRKIGELEMNISRLQDEIQSPAFLGNLSGTI